MPESEGNSVKEIRNGSPGDSVILVDPNDIQENERPSRIDGPTKSILVAPKKSVGFNADSRISTVDFKKDDSEEGENPRHSKASTIFRLSAIWDDFRRRRTTRHEVVPNFGQLPETMQDKHWIMFGYVSFFQQWIKPVMAEFMATWMLVFWACMLQPPPPAATTTGLNFTETSAPGPDSNVDALVPALAAGINLVIIICMFWDICVIQFNPCVTCALVFARVIPLRLLIPNILAQMGGAVLAAYFAELLRGYPVGMIPITDDSNLHAIFWAEFFFSFMMTFVAVMAILDPDYNHPLTPLVIGLTVTQGVLGGRYIGAGCMNPARVFGPAVITGDYNFHWLWWLSEILGAMFSVVIEALIFAPIVVEDGDTKSPLWWWRFFLWKNGMGRSTGRRRTFKSWADAIGGEDKSDRRNSVGIPRNAIASTYNPGNSIISIPA